MITLDELKTRAGLLLYRELPEEYRYRDNPDGAETGDLEALLHGCGHLLDLVRGTTEQAYADAFAEAADNDRKIQTWLLPYMAELVSAELLAPDPQRRLEELNNAVGWFKTKGTLINVDSVADVVGGAETVLVEGWRRVLITPRNTLPPFTATASAMGDGDPLGPATLPPGTPDVRHGNRAVVDPQGANPLFRLRSSRRDAQGRRLDSAREIYWKPRNFRAAPCFPGAYDDTSLRTPDLRSPARGRVGPHPRRTSVHVRPPDGFFEAGLKTVNLPATSNPLGLDPAATQTQVYAPARLLEAIGAPLDPAPDKIVVAGDLVIPSDLAVRFEDILFTGRITVQPDAAATTRLILRRCAVAEIVLGAAGASASLDARDCLFDRIDAASGFAQLVYCTVLGTTSLSRLWASDCLFVGALSGIDPAGDTCVRYSRVADIDIVLAGTDAGNSPYNTADDPNLVRRYFDDGGDCVLRPAVFGEPGAGVLDLTTAISIREGAEDSGEMGAYHHLFYSAELRAVKLKLSDFLPLGQEIALHYDAHLGRDPVTTA